MRISFYAPMKAPDDPVPSGDRQVARHLIAALQKAGHTVSIASRFRSYDRGDPQRQERLAAIGSRLARRLARRWDKPVARPDLWFTYHLYHKAPDHLGPVVSAALGIPYVVAEVSVAGKQRGGPFDRGYRASVDALRRADLVFNLNADDAAGIAPHLRPGVPMAGLSPFTDVAPLAAARAERDKVRDHLAGRFGLDPAVPWLVTAAMMRADQKLASYRLLAEALSQLGGEQFALLVAGTGPAEAEVRQAFAKAGVSAVFLGLVPDSGMPAILAASDLYVWPAIKEAFGMALVEAGAAGLPVVAGKSCGVAGVVEDGITGLLVPQNEALAFATGVRALLDLRRRAAYSDAARRQAQAHHSVEAAASRLDAALREVSGRFASGETCNAIVSQV
ncbi:glycosyltransferase family 4 protein [Jiella sp. MQZ9-1]|uniref:Glycosyltransferase family 4 protein n=1 Tax=Jiella flava TaxID=2816857 RepID=A0A939JX51_9HYPH|nr:glycosyltransferase family 4 protein [Jiella flava]MBO0663697.1 glycosyltransferase family 4 protein [Jiella flava]MCD2472270.1 glycosyltransferase family 4 protein [Jiella flava]